MFRGSTGEDGQAVGGQALLQGVDEGVGGRLGPCAEVQDGDQLGKRINRYPQP